MTPRPRITLISALPQSAAPAEDAVARLWPEAIHNHLIDDSLARDLSEIGSISQAIMDRFSILGRYAASAEGTSGPAAGLLFTCSAFGPAIDRVKGECSIPVVAPNEGAFEEALNLCKGASGGGRIGLLLTFSGSVDPLTNELVRMSRQSGQSEPHIQSTVVEGALAALQSNNPERHDSLISAAAARLPDVDAIILGQFSMARSAPLVAARRSEPVLTTPDGAVRKLRRLVEQSL